MKKILFCSLLFAMCIISCKRVDVPMGGQEGVGTLALSVADMTDYITVVSKADAGADYTDFSNYDVVIDGPTKINEKYSEFSGRVVELGSGTYSITITSPDTKPAEFDQPIYRAYEEFEIRAGEVTSLNLTLTPYNCKVTIELSENFKKELKTYEVVVGNGLAELVWTKDDTKNDFAEEKAGYFLARGLEIKVKGHRSIDDTEATAVYYVKNPQPGDHHIIKLDAKVTGVIEGIIINRVTEFNEVSNDIEIGGMDESYVDRPDFDDEEPGEEEEVKNEILWAAHPDFSPLEITPETQISMVIKMPAGIETFVVRVSDNFKGAISEITDGNKDYMDLINDPKIHENFGGDKSDLPTKDEIYHQQEVLFDLTSFVSLLCQAAKEGMTVDFILEATDVNGKPLQIFGDYPTITLIIPGE